MSSAVGASVNRPVDPVQRDKDIDSKLRLWGIVNAFSSGKLPTNAQIDQSLSSFSQSKLLTKADPKLSSEGKELLKDFARVVEETKYYFLTKNSDELLQDFIYRTSSAAQNNGLQPGEAPVNKTQAQQDNEKAMEGLKTLATLILSNGQFRKLLQDAQIILRDIVGDAATKTARNVRPSQDQLNQVDRPADDDTWHDVPELSRQNFKQTAREHIDRNKPLSRDDAKTAAQLATQRAHPNGQSDPKDLAHQATSEQRHGENRGIDAKGGLQSGIDHIQQRADEQMPDEHKDRAREYRERTSRYFQDKLPEERRDQAIWRMKKMVVEIQGHEDYLRAIDTLLDLAENYSTHAQTFAKDNVSKNSHITKDNHVKTAQQDLKTLIERFANYTSMDDFFDALNDLYADADRDPELKNYFKSINGYIRRVLREKGYILQPDSTHEYNRLVEQGRFLLRDRYREHTDHVIDEARFFSEQFAEDPESQKFGAAIQKFFQALGTNEDGEPTFKKHLLDDVTQIILPQVFDDIRYVPLPRVEFSDHQMDAVVENIVIESGNMLPNCVEFGADTYFRMGRKGVNSRKDQKFMLSASQIQADMRDIHYYVKRKQGFPAITDQGVADVFLGGDGFNFKLSLSKADKKDRAHFFKIDTCKVNISHLKIKLKESKHKALFGVAKPLVLKLLKPVILKALEKQIRDNFSKFDSLAFAVYQEAEKAKKEAKQNPDPDNIKNIYQRYAEAAKNEFIKRRDQAQREAQKVKQDKKVNVATTTDQAMFKDIVFEGGISTKATEIKKKAHTGDTWHNELFGLGSAKPSGHYGKPKEITRKSPHRRRAQLQHRQQPSSHQQSNVRASIDSGYQGNEFANKIVNEGFGTTQSKTAGDYALNAPIGHHTSNQAPMLGRYGDEAYTSRV